VGVALGVALVPQLLAFALWLLLTYGLNKPWIYPKAKILHPVTHFFSDKMGEEWKGDLREVRWQWQQQGYSQWIIRRYTFSWCIHLLWACIRCKVYDLVFARY
jgi:hypothetical protein